MLVRFYPDHFSERKGPTFTVHNYAYNDLSTHTISLKPDIQSSTKSRLSLQVNITVTFFTWMTLIHRQTPFQIHTAFMLNMTKNQISRCYACKSLFIHSILDFLPPVLTSAAYHNRLPTRSQGQEAAGVRTIANRPSSRNSVTRPPKTV